MYEKNLTEDLRLRLSEKDMDFLRKLSDERGMTVSQVIRAIIGEYRRSLDTISAMRSAIELVKSQQENSNGNNGINGGLSHGDTKTDFDDIV